MGSKAMLKFCDRKKADSQNSTAAPHTQGGISGLQGKGSVEQRRSQDDILVKTLQVLS